MQTKQIGDYCFKKGHIPWNKDIKWNWMSEYRKGTNNPMWGKGYKRRGKNNPNWRGGKMIDSFGYEKILIPGRKYVSLHRLMVEEKLKRRLKQQEVIHHIDGNRKNNNISNLYLFKNNKFHMGYEKNLISTYYNWIKDYNVSS